MRGNLNKECIMESEYGMAMMDVDMKGILKIISKKEKE